MNTRPAVGPNEYPLLSTSELRRAFLVEDLFHPGEVRLSGWEVDRAVILGAVATKAASLEDPAFLSRRELGLINLGGAGVVEVDGTPYTLEPLDALYVGRGAARINFRASPAKFYGVSFPSHAAHPTRLVPKKTARILSLGDAKNANRRTIYQLIHPESVKSSQLVMGFTEVEAGSVWNTMPPHTHARRCEIYLYSGLGPEERLFHLMGRPEETRHLVVKDGEAVLSPPWSLHFGCGTGSYRFVWAMGGENQDFDDMDFVSLGALR